MAKFTSIARALVAFGRGANLPYFGKQGNIMPYSPREQKRKVIRGFPGVSDITEKEKEPNLGVFSFTYVPEDILSSKGNFIRGNGTNSIDDIHSIDRMFYFYHEIRWNDVHIMVCVHVLDYLFCNLAFVHPGCLK